MATFKQRVGIAGVGVAVCVIVAVVFIARALYMPAGTGPCASHESASLTAPASFFIQQLEAEAIKRVGQPIEGFTPFMLLETFPVLAATDFECAQAAEGFYNAHNGEVIFTSTTRSSVTASNAESLTSYGMGTVLTNIARRLGASIQTTEEVQSVLNKVMEKPVSSGEEVVLAGIVTCLPHKNTSGPQTLECALGLETSEGFYYALKSPNNTPFPSYETGQKVEVRGQLSPPTGSERYRIEGTISVTNFAQ